jgi:serine/threonine protein kinase
MSRTRSTTPKIIPINKRYYYNESEKLGEGTFGTVYRGNDMVYNQKEVAVKLLKSFCTNKEDDEKLRRESSLLC